jgi:hypothetical protein
VTCRRIVSELIGVCARVMVMAVVRVAALVMAKGHADARGSARETLQRDGERYREQQDKTQKVARHRRRF